MKKLSKYQIKKIGEYRNFISSLNLHILKLEKKAESADVSKDEVIRITSEIEVARGRIISAENQIEYLRSK